MSAYLPPRSVRRLIIDPLWPVIAAAIAVVFALAALLAALVAPLTPRRRLLRVAMFGLVYLGVDVALLLGCFALWLFALWLRPRRARWVDDHCRLLGWALDRLQSAGSRYTGFEVRIDDAAIDDPPPGPVIVLARHAGPGDSFALVRLVLRRYRRRPRVVVKAALQWDPGVDVVLNRLSGYFVPSRTGAGEDVTDRLAELAGGLAAHDALILFPEGGNWTPRRQRRAVRHLRRIGRRRAAERAEAMPRVLPPRPAGTLACLAGRPDAHVVMVAHTGLDSLVNPGQIWRALPVHDRPMRISWWCVRPPEDTDPRIREAWLDEQWKRVEHWVTSHSAATAITTTTT
ncbi:MAG TPA: 1-acyl-sn-glycerol-3-phosphate acyltransferase [Jatrophihabitantaceae bacterium]|jgi:1-acyl-sn-glycerol-3-phosphate acyltransferase